jgi:hypothetical protein
MVLFWAKPMKHETSLYHVVVIFTFSILYAAPGAELETDQSSTQVPQKTGDLVEHVKDFLNSPPSFKAWVWAELNPNDLQVSQYHFVRYQPGAMLVRTAETLEGVLDQKNAASSVTSAGHVDDLWWHSSDEGEIELWVDEKIPSESSNRVRTACESRFGRGLRILLLGMDDIALSRSVIGAIEWEGNEFYFSIEREGMDLSSVFEGRIVDEAGTAHLYVRKIITNWPALGESREFNYRFEIEFASDGERWGAPDRITRWILPPEERERVIGVWETQSFVRSENSMPARFFLPSESLLESARIYYLVDSELVYQADDEWSAGEWRTVQPADDSRTMEPDGTPLGNNRKWYILIAAILTVPGIILIIHLSKR